MTYHGSRVAVLGRDTEAIAFVIEDESAPFSSVDDAELLRLQESIPCADRIASWHAILLFFTKRRPPSEIAINETQLTGHLLQSSVESESPPLLRREAIGIGE